MRPPPPFPVATTAPLTSYPAQASTISFSGPPGLQRFDMADQHNSYRTRGHRTQSQGVTDFHADRGTSEPRQEIGSMKAFPRAKWSHDMKLFLIGLLKDYDVPGFRTQNAWSKEAWTNIVCKLNDKFGVPFTLNQVKQKEQDLKKDYRSVKELLAESGFGWNPDRKMVDAPESVWNSFSARKNNKDALQWRDKSFPYFDELASLYEGRYAEGMTCHGMDYYANKANHASAPSSQVEVQGAGFALPCCMSHMFSSEKSSYASLLCCLAVMC